MATTAPEVGSPEWWLLRLLRRLHDRLPEITRWDDYYRGDQPLAFASQKFREAFGERFSAFTSNFCQLVVDATAERLEVGGFRFGSEEANTAVWDLWQRNNMDQSVQLAITDSLVKGMAYALVEPQAESTPVITVEDAADCIVERDAKDRRVRRAALKRWVDDEGMLVTYLYLPDAIYKFRTKLRWTDEFSGWWRRPGEWEEHYEWQLWSAARFEPWQVPGEEWPVPNRLGVVPMIELPNRPRLRGGGQSEIAPIHSNQDAVNKYRCDALIASEFAAFPQRYLLNFEPETDSATGRPKEPFRAAIDRLWTVPPPDPEDQGAPEPKFGQFAAASLEPYTRMIELEVGHISSISRLPYYYLLGSPQNVPPSGESNKSSEAGLIRKVGRAQLFLGEGLEDLMRVALLADGNAAAANEAAETVWVDSETRSEAVRTDAVVKLHAAGIIDDELAWELTGLTRAQVDALRKRREAAEAEDETAAAGGAPAPTNGQVAAPQFVPAPTGPQMSPTPVGGQPA